MLGYTDAQQLDQYYNHNVTLGITLLNDAMKYMPRCHNGQQVEHKKVVRTNDVGLT